jgi:hypothetical protein
VKIISKFKDYYDFVGQQYGGGDPALVLNRNTVKPAFEKTRWGQIQNFNTSLVNLDKLGINHPPAFSTEWRSNIHVRVIAFCGAWASFERPVDDLGRFPPGSEWTLRKRQVAKHEWANPAWVEDASVRVESAVRASILVGRPYFEVDSSGAVMDRFPILDNPILDPENSLGFHRFVSPQECYQRISNFLYEIRSGEPASPMSDKEKTLSHGFNQESFRNTNHRMR